MKKNLIIFGAGKIAQAVSYFFERDSEYEIIAYCCDNEYAQSDNFNNKPLITSDEIVDLYSSDNNEMFIALGYQRMNQFRKEKVDWAIKKGYKLVKYRSPYVLGNYDLGDNSIVMDGAVIQPCVTINNNVFVWGGTMIGHHSIIEDNCWLTGSCAIGGIVSLGEGCFVGLNATIGNEINIGKQCMLGAGTIVNKPLPNDSVLVQRDTEIHRLTSNQFSRMSQCFKA